MTERVAAAGTEHWGEDPKLVELLGVQGAVEFRALLDGFPDAVGVLWALRDARGRIVDFAFGYGNPTMLRAFRLPAATRERYTLLEALPRMRGSRAFDAYVRVCESGESWVKEVTYNTPFGDGYMLGTFVNRTAKLGDGVVNFLTDVTKQRRMEAELRSYADVVAHDLNEPVAGIAMLVGLLERRAEQPPSPAVLQQLRSSAERARDLIDGVLVYARAGELTREPVMLGELIAEAAEDLRARLDEAGATVEVGELPQVQGDRRQLRRVVQNVLANAAKFRGDAPLRVEVSAVRDSQEWVVTMRDNGVGVDSAQATRIFSMFSRANEHVDGAGIGLAVCRRIIEAHGGRIWVEPADGGGSAFRFTLPRWLSLPRVAATTPEHRRLEEARTGEAPWKAWGPYLSERQWGTVREDYSPNGDAWNYLTHEQARSRAYRWGEDGIAGICDDRQRLCLALALWNGADPILKERMFGLTNGEGNHGEDVKEYWFYLDSTPTHSYLKCQYKYPQRAFPYEDLVATNGRRGKQDLEYELLDTGIFDEDRYFDVVVEYAKAAPDDILMLVTVHNRGPDAGDLHLLPTLWFRNTWSGTAAPGRA